MCGIVGMVSPGGAESRLVRGMIDILRYRGPDDMGVYTDDVAGLGHARLSIIDIEGGAQPMSSQDGSLWITFNGEIFNYLELRKELIRKGHRFRTRSDTEVILHLYQEEGERCVERFNGQWAFAIWDRCRKKLFLSRDRMGIRPLFYTQVGSGFYFASEIKALFLCPGVDRELDLEPLIQVFTFWAVLPGATAFRNIRELPPGHSMTVENGRVSVSKYWRLQPAPDAAMLRRHPKDVAEELRALLLDAISIRLRADVPVGAYLSGGLDSTLVAALAREAVGDRLKTFSVAFEDAEFDESPWQEAGRDFLGTLHGTVRCSNQEIQDVFTDVVWHAEKPIVRTAPAPLYRLARLVRDSHLKVVLTGEGADEFFGGYDIFKEAKIRHFWAAHPDSRWRPLLLKRLYPYVAGMQGQSLGYLKTLFHVKPEDISDPFFSHLPRWRLGSGIRNFLSGDICAATDTYDPLADLESRLPSDYPSWTKFNQAEYLEASLLLPGYILSSQGDRVSMAHGVEGRYPFLDHRIIEFAAKLPPPLKMKVLDEKHLVKRVGKGLIPESIRRRHKQPYRAPDGASFFGPTQEIVEDLLSHESVRKAGIFDPIPVARLVDKFRRGGETGARDDMALVGILSTQLLLTLFLGRPASIVGGDAVELLKPTLS